MIRGPAFAVILAVQAGLLGCGDDLERCVGTARAALANGERAGDLRARMAVRVYSDAVECTGTLISPRAVVTAAHCVPSDLAQWPVTLRRGPEAEQCLGTGAEPCAPLRLEAFRDRGADVAVLLAEEPFQGAEAADLPAIGLELPIDEFDALGYGLGSYWAEDGGTLRDAGHGEQLIQGHFVTTRLTASEVTARATDRGLVCDGDSGGPALVTLDGESAIVGVLHDSDGSGAEPCTPPGGDQSWTLLGPLLPLIEDAIGPCRRFTHDGAMLADCSGVRDLSSACDR